jgi:hypothetical protein
MALGREYGLANIWTWRRAAMTRLCATALAQGIEVDCVRALARKRGLRVDPLEAVGLSVRNVETRTAAAMAATDGSRRPIARSRRAAPEAIVSGQSVGPPGWRAWPGPSG